MRKQCVLPVENHTGSCGFEQFLCTHFWHKNIVLWLKTQVAHTKTQVLSGLFPTAKKEFSPLFFSRFSALSTEPITTTINIFN